MESGTGEVRGKRFLFKVSLLEEKKNCPTKNPSLFQSLDQREAASKLQQRNIS